MDGGQFRPRQGVKAHSWHGGTRSLEHTAMARDGGIARLDVFRTAGAAGVFCHAFWWCVYLSDPGQKSCRLID